MKATKERKGDRSPPKKIKVDGSSETAHYESLYEHNEALAKAIEEERTKNQMLAKAIEEEQNKNQVLANKNQMLEKTIEEIRLETTKKLAKAIEEEQNKNQMLEKTIEEIRLETTKKSENLKFEAILTETVIPKEVAKYVETGKKLVNCAETINVKKLIDVLLKKKNDFFEGKQLDNCLKIEMATGDGPPFIFVCTSSGTGKTQLPFSLDIPLLYFCWAVREEPSNVGEGISIQPIYSNYKNISECLRKCVECDIKIINLYNRISTGNRTVINESLPLLFPHLICLLCASIIELKKKNEVFKKEPWVVTELRISNESTVNEAGITITTAKSELAKLFPNKSLPTIFFDECQRKDDSEFVEKYLYVRKCLRQLDLVGAFMGTNANLANYVSHDAALHSRNSGCPTVNFPWCFVIHKLAPILPEVIEENKRKCLEIVRENGNNEKMESVVENIARALEKERPLFVQIVFDILKEILNSNPRMNLNEVLDKLTCDLIVAYSHRKYALEKFKEKDANDYNYNNISLIHPEIYKKTDQQEYERDTDFEKGKGIHTHIAHLYIPEAVLQMMNGMGLSNCAGISILEESLAFTGTIKNRPPQDRNKKYEGLIFDRDQFFSAFSDEPFIQSGYIGKGNLDFITLGKYSNDGNVEGAKTTVRISMASAIEKTKAEKRIPSVDEKGRWSLFELTVSASALIASQCNGYSGCGIKNWFNQFVRDIRTNQSASHVPVIKIPEKLTSLMSMQVPMCAPSIGANWNVNLTSLVREDNSVNIGILKAFTGNEPYDFLIQDIQNKAIIYGECKTSKECVENTTVYDAFNQLSPLESLVKVVVVDRLDADNLKKYISRSKSVQTLNVYLLEKPESESETHNDYDYEWNLIHGGNNSSDIFLISVDLL